jgi:hypothetical protein
MTLELRIRRGSASDLPSLEPLWLTVHHRHVESMPQLAPYVDDATTWANHTRLYRELLKERRGFQSTWLYMSRFAGRPGGVNP